MTVYDVIDAKKRGARLSEEQIRFFVRAVADGSASDAQIAAFCMAVLLKGMTDAECFVLTDAMAASGASLGEGAALVALFFLATVPGSFAAAFLRSAMRRPGFPVLLFTFFTATSKPLTFFSI